MKLKRKITGSLAVGIISVAMLSQCSLEDLISDTGGGGLSGPTASQIIAGLKEALSIGTENAAKDLHQEDGYFGNSLVKIPVPDEVETALGYADKFTETVEGNLALNLAYNATTYLFEGSDFSLERFKSLRSELLLGLNRAAEAAAPLSVDIFWNAITNMTIDDGLDILHGDSTAATSYFHGKTISPLTSLFRPFVDSTLELVNAAEIWKDYSSYHNQFVDMVDEFTSSTAVSSYNSLQSSPDDKLEMPLNLSHVNTDLGEFTTTKALDGLFLMVGEEETKIRKDPLARVTDLLELVFGELDD